MWVGGGAKRRVRVRAGARGAVGDGDAHLLLRRRALQRQLRHALGPLRCLPLCLPIPLRLLLLLRGLLLRSLLPLQPLLPRLLLTRLPLLLRRRPLLLRRRRRRIRRQGWPGVPRGRGRRR